MILAALGVGVATWLDWWPAILRGGLDGWQAIVRAATGSVSIPNWLFVVLVLCAICVVGVIGLLLRVRFFEPPLPAGSDYRPYREDLVFGILWRWQYAEDGRMWELHCFCPVCDLQLFPRDVGEYRFAPVTMYPCEHCGYESKRVTGSALSVESLVRRHVQRKLRTGEWKNSLPSKPAP